MDREYSLALDITDGTANHVTTTTSAGCEVCYNKGTHVFFVTLNGRRHQFDSFECAVHSLAPTCLHCQCRIIGHGVEAPEGFYCCAHCARTAGALGARDHV
jgi:hypothetical protein